MSKPVGSIPPRFQPQVLTWVPAWLPSEMDYLDIQGKWTLSFPELYLVMIVIDVEKKKRGKKLEQSVRFWYKVHMLVEWYQLDRDKWRPTDIVLFWLYYKREWKKVMSRERQTSALLPFSPVWKFYILDELSYQRNGEAKMQISKVRQ